MPDSPRSPSGSEAAPRAPTTPSGEAITSSYVFVKHGDADLDAGGRPEDAKKGQGKQPEHGKEEAGEAEPESALRMRRTADPGAAAADDDDEEAERQGAEDAAAVRAAAALAASADARNPDGENAKQLMITLVAAGCFLLAAGFFLAPRFGPFYDERTSILVVSAIVSAVFAAGGAIVFSEAMSLGKGRDEQRQREAL